MVIVEMEDDILKQVMELSFSLVHEEIEGIESEGIPDLEDEIPFDLISITVSRNNTSGSFIKEIGSVYLYGNEEFGVQTSMFRCEKIPESVNDFETLKEYSLDMLFLFNLINSVRANEVMGYKPLQFVELKPEREHYRVICSADNLIYMNYTKKGYFLISELFPWHSYLPKDFKEPDVKGVLKSDFFINNLLVASVKYDVFLIAFLWNESQNNHMYYFINMYKIYELMNKTTFEQTVDKYRLDLESAIKTQLNKSKKYLGDFANNPGSSGVYSRHGGDRAGGKVPSIHDMMSYTNAEMLYSIRLYFARITM